MMTVSETTFCFTTCWKRHYCNPQFNSYTWYQGDQTIWKKCPIFLKVAKTVAEQNNAKLETNFYTAYLGENVINL